MDLILTSPYRIPKSPYERELSRLDAALFQPIPPALQSIWPLFKAIHQRTEPQKTTPAPPDDFMTTNEVAAFIKRSPNTIRLWCRLNIFPYIVVPDKDGKPGDRLFSRKWTVRWMEERGFNVPAE